MRFARLLVPALVALLPGVAQALASGPVVLGGAVITPSMSTEGVDFTSFMGPTIKVGYEMGAFFNNEFSFQYTMATGTASKGSVRGDTRIVTYAAGYQLTLDILKKNGFTPYFGGGLYLGRADIDMKSELFGMTSHQNGSVPYLEFHAVAGARYTLPSGLGFRADVAYSTYGGFFGWQPSIGVAYGL